MRPSRRVSSRVLGPLVAVALGLAACTGGDGGPGKVALTEAGNLDTAATAARLRAGGAVRIGGEITRGGTSAPVRARISWRPARAVFRFAVVAEGRAYRLQVRRVGREAWVQRAPASAAGPGAPVALLTPRGERRWVAGPAAVVDALGVLTAYDPVLTLSALARARVPMRRVGRERVRGRDSLRFVAEETERTGLLPGGARRYDLWVALADGRPTRAVFNLPDGRIRYDVAPAPVPRVAAPAPERIQPSRPAPAAPEPAGAFATVTEGEAAGVRYRVLAAPGTQGTECWKVESTPPFVALGRPTPSGVRCLGAAGTGAAGASLDERVQFVIVADLAAGFDMVGVVVPPGSALELVRSDGSRLPLPLADPERGFALYVGPADPGAGFLWVRLGGETAGCAPGEIIEPSELDDLPREGFAAQRRFPWACLPG